MRWKGGLPFELPAIPENDDAAGVEFFPVPARTNSDDKHQFKMGESVSIITLHTGRIVDGTVRAIVEKTDGVRLQVDYGKDETALVELWRSHRK